MQERNVDVAIIGAGSAGLSAYNSACEYSSNVLLIEGGPYGTTCARVGCMPSKLLIAAADAAHSVTSANEFGVYPGDMRIDGQAVMQRVRVKRDCFVDSVLESVAAIDSSRKLDGYAKFLDNKRLQVGEHTTVTAKAIVIATGSSPFIPEFFKPLGDRLITSEEVFDWHDLPESVAVFGAGAVGLELAQALQRLGVRVSLFGKGGALAQLTDPAVTETGRQILANELQMDLDSNVTDMRVENNGVRINFTNAKGQNQSEIFEFVLAATGRKANLQRLQLQQTDFELNDAGIPVFDPYTLRVGESNVFIAGDVNDLQPVLHEAAREGKIAGGNAGRFPDFRACSRAAPLSIVFCDPQIAVVGVRHSELGGRRIVTGEVSFADQGRSQAMGINRGVLRLYAEYGSGLILGAEMCAPQAEHLAHLLSWAVQQRLDINAMLELPFYHPVVEEGLRTALKDARAQLRTGLGPMAYPLECGPGT